MSKPRNTFPHIVILGGGYAGLTLASRLSAQRLAARITLIDAKPEFQERIRLHQLAAGQSLRSWPYQEFLAPRKIGFRLATATAILPGERMLNIRDRHGVEDRIAYDYLVLAYGSCMDLDAAPGVREFACHLSSVHDAQAAHQRIGAAGSAGRNTILVVGGGLTAIETAAELAQTFPHCRVHLALPRPLVAEAVAGGYSPAAVDYLMQAMHRYGVVLHTDGAVRRLQQDRAETDHGEPIRFDVCLWTCGFALPALAKDAGLAVNRQGQVVTDAWLRSVGDPHILAVGDAAQAASKTSGACRMSCAAALPMATAAARALGASLRGVAMPEFRYNYLFRNISLGRGDGVIQFVDSTDVPRNLIWTGKRAAQWKEYICRSTLNTVGLTPVEKPPALPPLRMLPQLLQAAGQYA